MSSDVLLLIPLLHQHRDHIVLFPLFATLFFFLQSTHKQTKSAANKQSLGVS